MPINSNNLASSACRSGVEMTNSLKFDLTGMENCGQCKKEVTRKDWIDSVSSWEGMDRHGLVYNCECGNTMRAMIWDPIAMEKIRQETDV